MKTIVLIAVGLTLVACTFPTQDKREAATVCTGTAYRLEIPSLSSSVSLIQPVFHSDVKATQSFLKTGSWAMNEIDILLSSNNATTSVQAETKLPSSLLKCPGTCLPKVIANSSRDTTQLEVVPQIEQPMAGIWIVNTTGQSRIADAKAREISWIWSSTGTLLYFSGRTQNGAPFAKLIKASSPFETLWEAPIDEVTKSTFDPVRQALFVASSDDLGLSLGKLTEIRFEGNRSNASVTRPFPNLVDIDWNQQKLRIEILVLEENFLSVLNIAGEVLATVPKSSIAKYFPAGLDILRNFNSGRFSVYLSPSSAFALVPLGEEVIVVPCSKGGT